MAAARKLYVLTQDGVIQGATYAREKADHWLNLGDVYDYTPVTPEDMPAKENIPQSQRSRPAHGQQSIDETNKLQRSLDRRLKQFENPLLQEQD
jgi:hypothetical protein